MTEKVEVIVEAVINNEQEAKIAAVANVKYRLPALGMYVVELPQASLRFLQSIDGVKALRSNESVMTCTI